MPQNNNNRVRPTAVSPQRIAENLLRRYRERVQYTAFVDPNVLEEVLRRRQLQDTIGEHLKQYHWDLFLTGTFRGDPDEIDAEREARAWVAQFGNQAYAWIAIEVGPNGGHKTHVHMLLGGLPKPFGKTAARRFWERQFGNAKVEKYDPKQPARFYVGKEPGTGFPVGTFKRHRTRRRGRKKPRRVAA